MIGFQGKTLTSPRLSFRLLEDQDRSSLFSILQEPSTTVPAGFLPISDEAAFDAFWADLTRYNSGIAILLEGKCIGYYHVNPCRMNEPEYRDKQNVMIGFLIGGDYRQKGYAAETLNTLNPYLLTRFDHIWADYFEENTASRKTIQKCGFREAGSYEMTFDALNGEVKRCIANVL